MKYLSGRPATHILRDILETKDALADSLARDLAVGLAGRRALTALLVHGPMPVGTLARTTGGSASATSDVVDRLAELGYVDRLADPADRRRIIVAPSPAVGGAHEKLRSLAHDLDGAFDAVAPEHRAAVVEFLSSVHQVLASHLDQLTSPAA